MYLTPREKDKLMVATAAMVARNRLGRGVLLNYPEAVALITDFVVEGARDGRTVADLMAAEAADCRVQHNANTGTIQGIAVTSQVRQQVLHLAEG